MTSNVNSSAVSLSIASRLVDLIVALRPKDWIKNFFVFAALIFSQNLLHPGFVERSILAFLIFCAASSSVYLTNDVLDAQQDRVHPDKRNRPIASGRLPAVYALALAAVLAVAATGLGLLLEIDFGAAVLVYLGLNLAYSIYLKHVVILDVFLLASFFLVRVVAGAFAIDVPISNWLIICTVLLSLFLGFGKRRHEVLLLEDDASRHRKILSEYSPYFLDQMMAVVTASTVTAYALYTMSEETISKFGTSNLPLTIPFVLYGIFRYLYLVHQKELGGSPTQLMLTDKPLVLTVVLWALAVSLIIYG